MVQLERDFQTIWNKVGQELILAEKSAKHPWHLMTLATLEQGLPLARIVVQRGFDAAKPALWFHTDYRSPKITQLQAQPQVCLLLYDAQQKRQLRLSVNAVIHHQNAISQQRWDDAKDTSRRCYLVEPAPSVAMELRESTLPNAFINSVPSKQEAAGGYENFAPVECRILQADILQLNADGGERCLIKFASDGSITNAHWLAP